jgi:hypothetical protein
VDEVSDKIKTRLPEGLAFFALPLSGA